RLVVGIATRETEEHCLASIRGRTVRAVEALARAYRTARQRGLPADDGVGERERVAVWVACTRSEATLWATAVELARRTAGEQLALWECAEAIAAEAASAWGVADPAGAGPAVDEDVSSRPVVPAEPGERRRAFPEVGWQPPRPALPRALAALAHDAA